MTFTEENKVFLDINNPPEVKLFTSNEPKYIKERIKYYDSLKLSRGKQFKDNDTSKYVSDENLIHSTFTGQMVTREFSANGCIPCSQSSSRYY